MSQKYKIIIGALSILIALGLLSYFNVPKWKTYTNNEYEFQIEYPSGFKVVTEQTDDYKIFSVIDPKNSVNKYSQPNKYFELYIKNKPYNYKDPTGPFPMTKKTIQYSEDIDKDTFNSIDGFTNSGAVEGGGGYYGIFFFSSDKYIYQINLNPNN